MFKGPAIYLKSQCLVHILKVIYIYEKYFAWLSQSFSCGPFSRNLIGKLLYVWEYSFVYFLKQTIYK